MESRYKNWRNSPLPLTVWTRGGKPGIEGFENFDRDVFENLDGVIRRGPTLLTLLGGKSLGIMCGR